MGSRHPGWYHGSGESKWGGIGWQPGTGVTGGRDVGPRSREIAPALLSLPL